MCISLPPSNILNSFFFQPPMSSSTNRAYLGLSKAQEYTLKPAYLVGASPFQLEIKHFGKRDTSQAMDKLMKCVWLAIVFKKLVNRTRERKQPVAIVYASVTGNAAKYASDLGAILRSSCNVSFVDACGANAAEDILEGFPLIEVATLVIFVTSTQGNGELPSLARKFFSILFDKNGIILRGKHCAVLGFGSSSYPIFCGAASELSKMLAKVDAKEVVPRGLCDSVKGEGPTFYNWTTNLIMQLASMNGASRLMIKLSSDMKDSISSSLVKVRSMVNRVKVEVFAAKEVETSAAMSFMTKRSGSMGTISRRRSSLDTNGRRTSMDSFGSDSSVDGTISASIERIIQIISSSSTHTSNEEILEGLVKSREDIISSVAWAEGSEETTRKTSVVKIDLQSCGSEFLVMNPYHFFSITFTFK
jgi:sulfite reductase alpha subunit-like flavoprotein